MQIVRVSQTDLFRVALEYLGDSMQWSRIARLNKMYDVVIEEPRDLMIPAKDPQAFRGAFR